MKKILVSLLVAAWFTLPGQGEETVPEAKVLVRVADEAGQPVVGAKVEVSFGYETPRRLGEGWGTRFASQWRVGTTDAKGEFSAEGQTSPAFGVRANKDGYYQCDGGGTESRLLRNVLLNRWEPWPLSMELVLKQKRHPVPMCYRQIFPGTLEVPMLNQSVGLDLEAGDWVAPHGKGKVVDFYVTLCPSLEGEQRCNSCQLAFPNSQDGIQAYEHPKEDPSVYRWPFEAPEAGYASRMSMGAWIQKARTDYPGCWSDVSRVQKTGKFIFRTRSVVDKNGKLVSACYGKLQQFEFSEKAVSLTYWFNPDRTRNLEEDPKHNLFAKP